MYKKKPKTRIFFPPSLSLKSEVCAHIATNQSDIYISSRFSFLFFFWRFLLLHHCSLCVGVFVSPWDFYETFKSGRDTVVSLRNKLKGNNPTTSHGLRGFVELFFIQKNWLECSSHDISRYASFANKKQKHSFCYSPKRTRCQSFIRTMNALTVSFLWIPPQSVLLYSFYSRLKLTRLPLFFPLFSRLSTFDCSIIQNLQKEKKTSRVPS